MIKNIFKKILPGHLYNFLRINRSKLAMYYTLLFAYWYDFKRYYYFSDIKGSDTPTKLIGKIIREYHVIEKGLTILQPRLGFGKDKIISLCSNCEYYISMYGDDEDQLKHAIRVISEYKQFHDDHCYKLEPFILNAIDHLIIRLPPFDYSQKEITKEDYFKSTEMPFPIFSSSRSSVRNYTAEDVPMNDILKALNIARTSPSACNRQSWRTYIYSDKELINNILSIQGGCRSFGYLTNKLIIITGETGVFTSVAERNQVYIDGGIYAMNLLYSLHYNQIAACVLNCCNEPQKDKQLRILCKIKESEVFIVMIACGNPPEIFKIAHSPRYEITTTNNIIC